MAGPTQEALLEMRRQEMALLDALVAAERRRQQTAMTPPEARILAEMIAEGRDVQSVPQGLFDVLEPPPAYAPYDTAPAREYQFGDVGSRMGEENLAAARDVFSNAGYVTRGMLPESVQSYVPPAVSYLPDMALGGLLGLIGGGEKVIGYGAEAVDAGVRNAVEGLGFDYRYAPGTGAQVLARDVLGGIDVSGVGPEARAMGAVLNAAGPAIRQGAIDRLNQPGPMPTTYSNPIPGFLAAPTDPEMPLPPLSNAQRTQITGTFPTYQKALGIFDAVAPEGRTLDYGAGRAMSSRLGFDTYEPFPLEGVNPTYRNAADIPDAAYDRLTNFNVLNVVPRDIRDSIVEDIGRVIRPGGTGLITTRGRDVLNAKGVPGPEPMSIITRPGTDMSTYQKGFTQAELQDYLRYILGDRYGVEPLRLGPAGALIRRNR